MVRASSFVGNIPPYAFAEVDRARDKAREKPAEVLISKGEEEFITERENVDDLINKARFRVDF